MSNTRNRAGAAARGQSKQAERSNHSTRRTTEPEDYRVSFTWADSADVSDREIEVIELYLGDALDRLLSLGRRAKARGPPD
jgi:hypothetical protein